MLQRKGRLQNTRVAPTRVQIRYPTGDISSRRLIQLRPLINHQSRRAPSRVRGACVDRRAALTVDLAGRIQRRSVSNEQTIFTATCVCDAGRNSALLRALAVDGAGNVSSTHYHDDLTSRSASGIWNLISVSQRPRNNSL